MFWRTVQVISLSSVAQPAAKTAMEPASWSLFYGSCGDSLDLDAVAEFLQTLDHLLCRPFGVGGFLEVVGAKVLVVLRFHEQMITGHQQAVGNRHVGAFDAAAGGQPLVLGAEVTAAGAAGAPRPLAER